QIKESSLQKDRFSAAEVTVLKARGNFRPLSTDIDLYSHQLA
ncbi:MAG: hypothetical protein ACI85S_002969, partial [Pseudohongiellaceae bacterium]